MEAVKLQKVIRKGSRVLLKISSLEDPLVVNEQLVHQHRLVDDIVLSPAQLEQLKVASRRWQCEHEAARLLAIRNHVSDELALKLRRKKFEPDMIAEVIESFRAAGQLDDAQYAHDLGQRLLRQKPCGRAYLISSLQRKHVRRELAEQVADVCLEGRDEKELAAAALEKRWREFGQFELEVARRKAYNYLVRRGFSFSAAEAAIAEFTNPETR